ncbi:MAG: hypothetical protein MJA29_11670 [Candidatus Omnitrophica bacterium]|nr:hypothetical protein [Candidatus Omnitrophota bacterium]
MRGLVRIVVMLMVLVAAVPGYSQDEAMQESDNFSLDIKGMDVVDVLKMLAERSGMDIAIGKNVQGKVTLFLKDVFVEDAFEIVILTNDLAYEEKNGIISVMTQRDYELLYGHRFQEKKQAKVVQLGSVKASEIVKPLGQIKSKIGDIVIDEGSNTLILIDSQEKIREMEEFVKRVDMQVETRVFRLNYARADELAVKLQDVLSGGAGAVRLDERTNKLVVTDYAHKFPEIERLISEFDERTPQVLIDAQIIEIRPSDKFEMGVDWDYWIRKNFRVSQDFPVGSQNRLILGTLSQEPTAEGEYKAVLDMLRTIGDTKILSSPRILALHNQEARILVGTKDAYITSSVSQAGETAITSQEVNFVDVGIKLFVTPHVNREGMVTMKIRPEISSAERVTLLSEGKETQIPIVTTSEAETTIMVKDGVTVIIGGLRQDEHAKTVKQIPLLGDIPVLGHAFRSTSNEVKQAELVILLTPYILSGDDSYTDTAQLQPDDGAVASMVDGDIVHLRFKPRQP